MFSVQTLRDGKLVADYQISVTPRGTADANNSSRNIGLSFTYSIETFIYDPAAPNITLSPALRGLDGLGTYPIKPFTFSPNGVGISSVNRTITPALSSRNTQVSGLTFGEVYGNAPPQTSNTVSTLIRCDNASEVSYGTGCVNVNWTPTLDFYSSEFPNVTQNITLAQATTQAGVAPNNPLVRATSDQAVLNRKFSCSDARISATLPAKPDPTSQCDEYPFASSTQGGNENVRIMWVPGPENQAQGDNLLGYYRTNRLMAGDNFYVRIR